MKDKEMIEDILEIAKFVNRSCGNVSCKECDAVDNLDEGQLKGLWCNDIKTAINIYNAGYRKLPEDSVVLSREEYKELLEKARIGKNQCIKIELETIMKAEEKARKETAEQFLQLAYDRSLEKSFIKKVEELARQFGVEIKEN